MLIKFKCETRNYNDNTWELYDVSNLKIVDKTIYDICPIRDKLMNQDIVKVDNELRFLEVVHSCNRSLPVIPAIISLKKMYGKENNKYMFKATPDDRRVPEFIVPYKIKKLSFHKKHINKYVIIRFNKWNGKHPEGTLVTTIGDVNILPNFYEYMLYCKSLHASLQKFNEKTHTFLRNTNSEKHIDNMLLTDSYNVIDRREWDVICIDPKTSKDFDDGFGIKKINHKSIDCYMLSIYIANVPLWIDSMNLWSSFTERISTIYLPDRKRPMLPSILSDNLCSLQKGNTRFAFALDVFIDNEFKIFDYQFSNVAIQIKENYDYDDTERLYKDKVYTQTLNLISEMNHYTRYKYCNSIIDSHDVIAYLMVLMNYLSAQKLKSKQNGIFRSIKLKTDYEMPINIPSDIQRFVQGWNSTGGKYLKYQDYEEHQILKLDAYVHITSPIRRLVDILNIMLVMNDDKTFKFVNVAPSIEFFNKWTSTESMGYINTSMRAIRKLQNKCELLQKCYNNPSTLETLYNGYCFDKLDRNDGLFQYVVYLPALNMVSKFTGPQDINHFEERKFQLYLFKDESTFKQKIKMNLIE